MPRYINPVPGYTYPPFGKLYFYKSGTNSELTTFSDELETIPNPNPVKLDSVGRVPNVFYTAKSRVVLQDADNEQEWERDPVGGEGSLGDFELYDEVVVYEKDDITKTADGIFYISLQDLNQGNSPALSPASNAYWMQISFIDMYNSSKSYSSGNVAQTTEGYLWRSITNANAGNDPVTDNGTYWLPAINGAKITEVIELKRDTTTVIPQTGGGALTAKRDNELQDAGAYTLPLANTVLVNQTITVSQPDSYASFAPTVTRAGSNTITYRSGTDTVINFNSGSSISLTLTSDGVSDWRL
jgi:hypothetical protein